jgi:hypothetical protein
LASGSTPKTPSSVRDGLAGGWGAVVWARAFSDCEINNRKMTGNKDTIKPDLMDIVVSKARFYNKLQG